MSPSYFDKYIQSLAQRIPDHTVEQLIRSRETLLQHSSMMANYNSSNVHLRAFVRIILDDRQHILLSLFDEALRASATQPLQQHSGYGEFRFLVPSGKRLCDQYYVSFSPLGVLFFLFAWTKHYHKSVTKKYMSESEFTCVQNLINSCRFSPDVLLRATEMLNERPDTDICKAISRAVEIQEHDPSVPIHLEQVALPNVGSRYSSASRKAVRA